jgi:hypothetical protein
MSTFHLARSGDVDVEFDGDLLADESSRTGDQPRWTQVRIYRTASQKFVTEVIGKSAIPGETDRPTVIVHNDTDTIRAALMRPRKDGPPYLTDTAFNALYSAGQKDHRIMSVLTDHI